MVIDEGSPPLFKVGVTSDDAGRMISLEGELDLGTVSHLDEALMLALQDDPRVVIVDLRGLAFMDSTGIRSLLQIRERCNSEGRRLLLVPGGRPIQRVLEVSGVADRFDYMTVDESSETPHP